MVIEESLVSIFSLPVLSSSEERLGSFLKTLFSLPPKFSFLHALGMLFAMLTHWVLWLPTFWTSYLQWSGWASLLAGEEHLRGF